MRAVVIRERGGPEVLAIEERPDPEPGPGQVRVRVRAAALNRADLLQRRGLYPAPPGSPADVPGLEYAGEVEALGDGVTAHAVGDRVFGILGGGGQGDRVVVHERMAVPVPERLSWIEAAAVPEVFVTAHDALVTQGELSMGETVLVHAAGGGVGTAALQIARVLGARVLGTASAGKLARLADAGLDAFLDRGIDREEEDFAAVALEETEGAGVQLVLDSVGPAYWERNLKALARKGRLVLIGLMGMDTPALRADLILTRRLRVTGTVLRSRPLEEKIAATRAFARAVVPHLASGAVRPVVDEVYPLERVREAHEHMEANRNLGKIVLEL